LNIIFASFVSFFSTFMPLLVALIPAPPPKLEATGTCNITTHEATFIQAVFETSACSLNTTLGTIVQWAL
jgi:hypothetical protein